jgi:hypothetical protein
VRALKVLVVGMGVLIVVGTVTLVVLVVQRAGGLVGAGGGAGAPVSASLGLPEGARIAGIAGVDRGGLAVWVTGGPEGDRVLLVDPRSGRVTGDLRIRP